MPVVDERLQGVHRAVEEERGVVVVGRTGEQLDVERAGGCARDGLALEVDEAEAVEDRVGLLHADLVVVERRVVVDVLGVADQAVVGDDGDVAVLGVLQHARERGAVDRGDDQGLGALGDHVLDLGDLGGDVVLGVLQVDLEALRPRAAP